MGAKEDLAAAKRELKQATYAAERQRLLRAQKAVERCKARCEAQEASDPGWVIGSRTAAAKAAYEPPAVVDEQQLEEDMSEEEIDQKVEIAKAAADKKSKASKSKTSKKKTK